MIIYDERPNRSYTLIDELGYGECFVYREELYMLLNNNYCCRLCDGFLEDFDPNTEVQQVEAHITIVNNL